MKIARVSATCHNIPVRPPLLDMVIDRPIVFVRVETDEGLVGYGMTGHIQRFGVRELVNRELAPLLRGQDPLNTERLWHQMYLHANPRSQTGAWSSAVSAVDIALWDLKGKYLGQPSWRLMGGYQSRVPAYITFGLLEYDRDQLAELARQFVAQGHDKLKMVVAINGAEDPQEDAARVRAVREAVGPSVRLMVDANYLFSLPRAVELARRIEEYDIAWFEEPVYGNDAGLLAQLRRQTRIPIAAGQNEGHRFRHRDLIVAGAVDIVQPNVCYVGGYTEGLKVAAMAQAFNLLIANGGGWPHHNLHLQAAVSNGWGVEYHYPMWKVGDTVFQDPPSPEAGWVTAPETPGLGLEPREDALREYLEE